MTNDEKINYLRIALALQGIGINNETSERIIATYEKLLEKGGKFSVEDAVCVEMALDKKYIKERIEVEAKKQDEA